MVVEVSQMLDMFPANRVKGASAVRVVSRYLRSAVVVLATAGFSQVTYAAPGWTGYGKILSINPQSGDSYYVNIDVSSNPSDCQLTTWFYKTGTTAGVNRIFAALLSAQATGAMVRVYVTGNCTDHYNEISSVWVLSEGAS